jgi:uncharacterized protein with PQ loop repeat
MDDFNTINSVIAQAVKNSSYITVLISSCIFIIYTLIIKVVDYFKAKSRSKPLIEMANAITQVSNNVVKLNQILDKTFRDFKSKEATKIHQVIRLACDSFKSDVIKYCEEIIIHNNVHENRDNILQNTYRFISNEYYKLYSIFSTYEIDDVNVATKINKEWVDEINKECLDIIFDDSDKVNRIKQLNTKLQIKFDEYSTYIDNRMFNH